MRVLVVGASGFLGANVSLRAVVDNEVVVHSSTAPVRLSGGSSVVADLTAPGSADALVRAAAADLVLNCAALADIDACERNPARARRLNVDLPGELAGACAAAGSSFVHVSTDAVFGAVPGPYAVDTPVSPVNEYGRTKAEGEQRVLEADSRALVARTNIVGFTPTGRRNLLEYFLNRLEEGMEAPGFGDVWFRPILVDALWPLVSGWVAEGRGGILHATGPTYLSKLEFGRRVAGAFGLDPELVVPAALADGALEASRGVALDVTPSPGPTTVAAAVTDLEAGLVRLAEARTDGLRQRLAALSPHAGGDRQ